MLFDQINSFFIDTANEKGVDWYRSKEQVPINFPFVGDGYLSNKKWPLIEGNTFFIYCMQLKIPNSPFII